MVEVQLNDDNEDPDESTSSVHTEEVMFSPQEAPEDDDIIKEDATNMNTNDPVAQVTSATARDSSLKADLLDSSDGSDRPDSKVNEEPEEPAGFLHSCINGISRRMARNPCIHLVTALSLSIGLSVIAFTLGGFSVAADNAGWQSRGTLISDRHTQYLMIETHRSQLFQDDELWQELSDNVQGGWETDDSISSRRLSDAAPDDIDLLHDADMLSWKLVWKPSADYMRFLGADGVDSATTASMLPQLPARRSRHLQASSKLTEEELTFYLDTMLSGETRLWPMWKVSSSKSALNREVIADICKAEQNTQAKLEASNLCILNPHSGDGTGCYLPYSVVLYARLYTDNGMTMSCDELGQAWNQEQATTTIWKQCVSDIHDTYTTEDDYEFPSSCPPEFAPFLVNDDLDETGRVSFTSSAFATRESDVNTLYDMVDSFDRGSGTISGAYDTQNESFGNYYADTAVTRDMSLALGSAVVTALAILIHTRSPFLTGLGLLQIILSFPLAYFVYVFMAGLNFFPFLNFIGVFVVFALGADDIFVAVDKWKNARLENPDGSTEDIAVVAFPDAAEAMFLTTVTTAIAFFGTAICPVAPIKMFAVFCGLLIMFDYLMNLLLVFPALCIYDRRLMENRSNCCISCCAPKPADEDELEANTEEAEEEKPSLIRRILLAYYNILHRFRWVLLALSIAGLAFSTWIAATLQLPTSADVRLLSDKHQFEQNYAWRQYLLEDVLQSSGGSLAGVVWGLTPADTGDQNDPQSWSQLVVDGSFDASPADAQVYLKDFCTSLFEQDFASPPDADFVCPFDKFDAWLQAQSVSEAPEAIYTQNCAGAASVPVAQDNFDDCIIAWSQSVNEMSILPRNGKVTIISFVFTGTVRFDDPFDVLKSEWNKLEDWFNAKNRDAPDSVDSGYFTSIDFWWYDTNASMLTTAYGSAGIALTAAALIILLSSRSLVLTVFCTITISYVLTSVTAGLVGLGWTLGFLESICFAILIGVSVDFVIHFTHAYASLPGNTDRSERTKYALIHMGPSILAAAVTTISSAVIMLFTIIIFFQKFALILFLTVIQASVGSFVVFLTLTDCIGPSQPTYLADKMAEKCCAKKDETE